MNNQDSHCHCGTDGEQVTGQAVARYAKGLDLHVLGVRTRPQSTPFVDEVVGRA